MGESGAAVFGRSDGALFAKCADALGIENLCDERDRLVWLDSTDVPCAAVEGWQESDEGACLVTTALRGTLACDVPEESVPRTLASLAAVLRTLHAVPVETCPFERTLAVTMPVVEDVVRRGAVNPGNLDPAMRTTQVDELLAGLHRERDQATRLEVADLVVCHGDACLPNFVLDPETLECVGVVDVGRLGVADRYLDLSLLAVSIGSPDMNPQYSAADEAVFLREYGLPDPDASRLRFYRVLDALSWG